MEQKHYGGTTKTPEPIKRIKRLEELALVDEEVEIYNPKYFHQQLEKEVERARRHLLFLSLVMLKISFADGNGSASSGKSELRDLGALTQGSLRCTDIVALASEDVVGIILPETADDGALKAAKRLCNQIESYNFAGPSAKGRKCQVSMGVSSLPIYATTPSDLISTAQSMLHQAQQEPVSRIRIFSKSKSALG